MKSPCRGDVGSPAKRERKREEASNISVLFKMHRTKLVSSEPEAGVLFCEGGRERERQVFPPFLSEEISARMSKCSRLAYQEQRCTENDVFYPFIS